MINRLVVQGLRGLDEEQIDLDFDRSLNIITGRNGSGKTTLLKLIWYLTSGNIHVARNETPFSIATIETDHYSMTVDLTDPEKNTVTVDRAGQEHEFVGRSDEELDEEDLFDDEENVLENAGNFTEDFGSSLFFPTFRRVEGGYTIPRVPNLRRALSEPHRRGSIDEALHQISRRLSNMDHNFICSVSTVDIAQLVVDRFNSVNAQYSSDQQKISSEIITEIRAFEDKSVSQLPMQSAEEILSRIKRAIEAVDKNRAELMKPLREVEKVVEDLFNKGAISFNNKYSFGSSSTPILSEYLSAGEKQMLSFICYNAFFNKASIFIDEPELSLHVDWQRELFPVLEAQETTNQFIVATHSPFIYSSYPDKELMISSDRGASEHNEPLA